MRIKDRNVKLDVERGRTVKAWLPRRYGGGLGGRGYTKAMLARPPGGGYGGGYRGGYKGFDGGRGRGGFRGGFGGRGGFRRDGGGFGGRDDRNGYGAPSGAPSGPGFDRRNGDRHFSGGYDRDGGRSYDDRRDDRRDFRGGGRDGGRFGDRGDRRTGSNSEPIGRREGGYRDHRDRDHDRPPRDDDSRKRGYDGGGYDESRKHRRY